MLKDPLRIRPDGTWCTHPRPNLHRADSPPRVSPRTYAQPCPTAHAPLSLRATIPSALDLRGRAGICMQHHTPGIPPRPPRQIVDHGTRAPVRVSDDAIGEAVPEGCARHAIDEDCRVARLEDKIVDVRGVAEDAAAEHQREAPL